jgi:hypothetical protein
MQAPYTRLFNTALRAAITAFLYSVFVILLSMGGYSTALERRGSGLRFSDFHVGKMI